MSSGRRKEQFNTRERLVSNDLSRLQDFAAADSAEDARQLYGIGTNFNNGYSVEEITIADAVYTPTRADILDGLIVLPQPGKTSLYVTAGIIGLLDPDGQTGSTDPNPPNPDDSSYKIVRSVGIAIDGLLVMTPNAGPGIRIDVIECQRIQQVQEQDNRDIFNPATGLFVPANVDKVTDGELTFRVRLGVQGNGFPGVAQGWCPLAVASSPSGSTTTDQVTFWDVRPVVKDRARAPFRGSESMPPVTKRVVYADIYSNPGHMPIGGFAMGPAESGNGGNADYWAGGHIYRGIPGDDSSVDGLDSANYEQGFALPANGPYYLWFLLPNGLPRWVKYNDTPFLGTPSRFPFGGRGIPTISGKGPASYSQGWPSSAIVPPALTGLTGSSATTDGLLAFASSTVGGFVDVAVTDGLNTTLLATIAGPAPSTHTPLCDRYTLVAGTHFPANAKSVKVRVEFRITPDGSVVAGDCAFTHNTVRVLHDLTPSYATEIIVSTEKRNPVPVMPFAALNHSFITREFEVPRIPPGFTGGPADGNLRFEIYWDLQFVSTGGGTIAKDTESCNVLGWRL